VGLKALAVAALQQCAPRTIDSTLQEITPAHHQQVAQSARTLSAAEQTLLILARRAIVMAELTPEQRASRLADVEQTPAIARFWAALVTDSPDDMQR